MKNHIIFYSSSNFICSRKATTVTSSNQVSTILTSLVRCTIYYTEHVSKLRWCSGYYQQQADYKIDIELDDKNAKLNGSETVTYYNNSPDNLDYLWVQLDQNQQAKDSESPWLKVKG
jgi:hypothetical protein